ncbi:methionine ABC transporter ATP-binding protein [Dietzia sp.]|uniref:methionine ABC transporter ATP-binding protein n=1 Tax=Dietzia sp. TaxID=1871616 RepID=UPI002FD912FE
MIELENVGKVYPGGVTALEAVNLSIPAGEIHGIVGRSGAGKSTLIRCITGLDPASSGSVRIDGVDMGQERGARLAAARRRIGMVSQGVDLLDSRTAEGNIEHPLEIAGVAKAERKKRVDELLELVGLTERRKNHPAQLSGGQRQRVGIARALAASPSVLLCDEPTSALDSATTRQILDLVREIRDRLGVTVLIITHEMSVVREICDSVTLLADGRIERTGQLLEVIRDTESPLAAELIPMPSAGRGDSGSDSGSRAASGPLVEVMTAEGEGRQDLSGLLAALGKAGHEPRIAAGTVETLHGAQVGRLHMRSGSAAEAEEIARIARETGAQARVLPAGDAADAVTTSDEKENQSTEKGAEER